MNLEPVIRRELQSACRRKETWRLRLVFAGGALAAVLFGLFFPKIGTADRGRVCLICISVAGFGLSTLAGAYVTADTLTAEKREGTLGLLFLTPLRGWEIVCGKMFSYSWQVKYAVLGGFPLMFFPVLLGGVVWAEVIRVLLAIGLTLVLSLACGVLWSTLVKEGRTAVLATIVTMLLLTFVPWFWVLIKEMLKSGTQLAGIAQLSPMTALVLGFEGNYRAFRSQAGLLPPGATVYWSSIALLFVLAVACVLVSGFLLTRLWRRAEEGSAERNGAGTERKSAGKAARPVQRYRAAVSPLLAQALRAMKTDGWTNWIRWLIVPFFAVMLLVALIPRYGEQAFICALCAGFGLHVLTRMEWALTGTRWLHEERRSGALEIVLTTPITDEALLKAHHDGIKRTSLRRFVLLLVINACLLTWVTVFSQQLRMHGDAKYIFATFFIGGTVTTAADFVTFRWLTLREALRNPTALKAAGRSFTLLEIPPWMLFAREFLSQLA